MEQVSNCVREFQTRYESLRKAVGDQTARQFLLGEKASYLAPQTHVPPSARKELLRAIQQVEANLWGEVTYLKGEPRTDEALFQHPPATNRRQECGLGKHSDRSQRACEDRSKAHLFAPGFRACDVLLIALLLGGVAIAYQSVVRLNAPFDWGHALVLGMSSVALLGLLRVRAAFALLAIPFFIWAGYSAVRAFFFPPEWADLVNPVYAGKWAISIAVEYLVGAYFWKKFSDVEFVDWVSSLVERSS